MKAISNVDQEEYSFGDRVALTTSSYTVPSDGYITAIIPYNTGRFIYIKVNDVTLIQLSSNTDDSGYPVVPTKGYQQQSLFVKKGMTVRISSSSGQSDVSADYYPVT